MSGNFSWKLCQNIVVKKQDALVKAKLQEFKAKCEPDLRETWQTYLCCRKYPYLPDVIFSVLYNSPPTPSKIPVLISFLLSLDKF